MPKPESLFISRAWLPLEHEAFLARHKDEINYYFPGVSIGWRKLGRAGVMLVQAGEYLEASRLPASKLGKKGTLAIARKINSRVPNMPSEGRRQVPEIAHTDIQGDRPIVDIAYFVGTLPFVAERNRFTRLLDTEAKVEAYWPAAAFFVSVATIPRELADNDLRQAFEAAQPDAITLLPAKAQTV